MKVSEVTAKHTYKASMFEMIFSNEKMRWNKRSANASGKGSWRISL